MSKFSIDTEKLNEPIKVFGDASGKLEDYSRQLSEVGTSLDPSFSQVIPVVEALARRTKDRSAEVQILGLTLNSAAKEYAKFEQIIVNNSKNRKTTLPNPKKTPGNSNPGNGSNPNNQGQYGDKPGQGGNKPGQGGTNPGQGGTNPGQGTTDPSQGTTDPSQNSSEPGYLSEAERNALAQEAAAIANSGQYEYQMGGTGSDMDGNGIGDYDCSGFVMEMYKKYGINLPHNCEEMWQDKNDVLDEITEGELQPGDLVFVDTGGRKTHVMIYLGDGKVAEAASEKTGMIVRDMRQSWRPNLTFARPKRK